jgi:MSHA biogenesis protein MshM
MVLEHFGLREAPFGLTPDTGFTYRADTHIEALATLSVALRAGEGFIKITGEVGTGKTLLCRTLLAALAAEPGFVSAYLPHPRLTPRELLRALARELSLRNDRRLAETDLHGILEAGLLALATQGRTVVLCIDEAQSMPPETMEALRLLSNLETEKRKLLQIVLFGQPELDLHLATPLGRALASRIGFAARLGTLGRRELGEYLNHRMRMAGWRGPEAFSAPARWALWWASGGLPRKANILAHKCLLLAYGGGGHRVRLHHAWVALRDSEFAVHPSMDWRVRRRTEASGAASAAHAALAGAPT